MSTIKAIRRMKKSFAAGDYEPRAEEVRDLSRLTAADIRRMADALPAYYAGPDPYLTDELRKAEARWREQSPEDQAEGLRKLQAALRKANDDD